MWTKSRPPQTDGNLALKDELSRPSPHPAGRPALRLLYGGEGRLIERPVSQLKQLALAIGVSLTLCLLWILFVFILYRIVRATL